MTTFGDIIVRKWHVIENKEEQEKQYELSLRILDQKKARFGIFLIYFILLIVFNIAIFNGSPILGDERIGTAILQSFATFIAYDRLITNWNSLKISK